MIESGIGKLRETGTGTLYEKKRLHGKIHKYSSHHILV